MTDALSEPVGSDQQTGLPAADPRRAPVVVPVAPVVHGGAVVDHVALALSFGIIERFSEGLYSSPNKAFEELVTNSYDAGARRVWVAIPDDLSAPSARIVVVDDGESMNQDDLHSLWKIGESRKRTDTPPPGRASPVGKFGIGKLATYVLARSLTYVAYRDGEYRAVSMNFALLENRPPGLLSAVDFQLQVVALDKDGAMKTVADAFGGRIDDASVKHFIAGEPDHWTAAILGDLKPAAAGIQLGRLRWILRTALPLHPDFQLTYNGETLEPAKTDREQLWTFGCGVDEGELPSQKGGEPSPWANRPKLQIELPDGSTRAAVSLEHAGPLAGEAILFKDPITSGKSGKVERSHGFFVRVRGRLINLGVEAADFDLDVELRHGTLSRFFMEVWVDGLDVDVAAARESIRESAALDEVKAYLKAVFNRARAVAIERDQDDPLVRLGKDNRLADPPLALSQGPLRRMLRRAAQGDVNVLESLGIGEDQVAAIEPLLQGDSDLVDRIVLEPSVSTTRLVSYDPSRQTVVLNQAHPFVANYEGAKKVGEPLRLLGLTELLTEAYLLDENVSPEVIRRVMKRRDSFLRALVKRYPRSATVIAQHLKDARNDEADLEDAVGDALELLGYHVVRRGGAQHGTDGIATAILGRRTTGGALSSYAFTYDAKSKGAATLLAFDDDGIVLPTVNAGTIPGRIRADTARTSILRVHREDLARDTSAKVKPHVTVLVAPDFQGAEDSDSQIVKVCRNDSIVPIRVGDLARLVEVFPLQGLTPVSIRPLLDLRTPSETREWIEEQARRVSVPRPRIDQLLRVLQKYSDKAAATQIQHLHAWMIAEGWEGLEDELEGLVRGLHALAPSTFYYQDGFIALNASVQALYDEIRDTLAEYEEATLVEPYLDSMADGPAESA